jgi:hypothetical protein
VSHCTTLYDSKNAELTLELKESQSSSSMLHRQNKSIYVLLSKTKQDLKVAQEAVAMIAKSTAKKANHIMSQTEAKILASKCQYDDNDNAADNAMDLEDACISAYDRAPKYIQVGLAYKGLAQYVSAEGYEHCVGRNASKGHYIHEKEMGAVSRYVSLLEPWRH